ncbi:hypothetical protein GGI21_006657, partial [Coemansia aciculifera]
MRKAENHHYRTLSPEEDVAYDEVDEDDTGGEEDEEEVGGEATSKQARLMRACDTCRRKKVKCDGDKPSCSHCTRMRLACHYSPLVRKKRVRRTIVDKLEERLQSMELMLQPLVARLSPNDPIIGAGGFGLGFGFAPAPPPPPSIIAPLPPLTPTSVLLMPPIHVIEELMEIAITRMTPTAPPVSWASLVRRLRSSQLPEYIVCGT